MERFGYVRAQDVSDAVRLLSEPGVRSRVLCGGTDLMVQVRQTPPDWDRVVDVSLVAEMKGIHICHPEPQSGEGAQPPADETLRVRRCAPQNDRRVNERIRIGAAVTFAEVLESEWLCQRAPFLARACAAVGAVQIRNTGTLGGNIANAAACADTLPVLACLDAEAVIASPRGERRELVSELVQGPYSTHLNPGELIVAFEFDALPPGARTAFVKLGRRNAMTIARLSMAAMGRWGVGDGIDLVRIAPGAAFTHTRRATEVEAALIGQVPSDELFARAGQLMAQAMIAESGRRWSTEYKEPVMAALTKRVLWQVFGYWILGIGD